MRAAVLGSPIKHSLSPLLHESAYKILGVEGSYEAIEIHSSTLDALLDRELATSFEEGARKGFNLTMPLKESVFEYRRCKFDALSTRIRSANTLLRSDSGFTATSTDATAFGRLLMNQNVERVVIIGGWMVYAEIWGREFNKVRIKIAPTTHSFTHVSIP